MKLAFTGEQSFSKQTLGALQSQSFFETAVTCDEDFLNEVRVIQEISGLRPELEIGDVAIVPGEILKEWQRPAPVLEQSGKRNTAARPRRHLTNRSKVCLLSQTHCATDLKSNYAKRQTKQGYKLSLEFAVQYSCPLRERFTEEQLRKWGRLANMHTILTTGDQSVPSQDKLQWVEEARDQIEIIQAETAICSQCLASLPVEAAGEGEAVGCLGRITYPVEAQFEKFLADRVQLALDTMDEADQPRLMRILVDPESPFDGEATKELRRVTTPAGLRFFELRLAINLSRAGSRITTDNLFDLLAGFRAEDDAETSYTRELPLAAAGDYYDFLDLILRNDLNRSELERLTTRSRNYLQFFRFLLAIERAEALNTRILLD